MAENSNIEWTHHTFNPWRGCTKVSPACENCYAETMSKRNPEVLGVWGKYGTRSIAAESYWRMPLKWNRDAEKAGERRRVFCASLADIFEGPESMPKEAWAPVSEARNRLGVLIGETPCLDWLLLTKRPENVLKYGPIGYFWTRDGIPPNVWIGTTVENQEWADKRIPELLKIPAKVRFLSVEPLLGPIDFSEIYRDVMDKEHNVPVLFNGIDWVICGGESGSKARPMNPDWVRSIRDQCVDAGVSFFFKQWGEYAPNWLNNIVDGEMVKIEVSEWIDRIGKKAVGRLLDGREWNEYPQIASGTAV